MAVQEMALKRQALSDAPTKTRVRVAAALSVPVILAAAGCSASSHSTPDSQHSQGKQGASISASASPTKKRPFGPIASPSGTESPHPTQTPSLPITRVSLQDILKKPDSYYQRGRGYKVTIPAGQYDLPEGTSKTFEASVRTPGPHQQTLRGHIEGFQGAITSPDQTTTLPIIIKTLFSEGQREVVDFRGVERMQDAEASRQAVTVIFLMTRATDPTVRSELARIGDTNDDVLDVIYVSPNNAQTNQPSSQQI